MELEQQGRLREIQTERHLLDAGLFEQRRDLGRGALEQPDRRRDRAPQSEQAGLAVLRRKPRGEETMVLGGRAEVPHDRLAAPRQQAITRHLVARPLADRGRGHVADVVDVEQQQRPHHRQQPRFALPQPSFARFPFGG